MNGQKGFEWSKQGKADWSNINYVMFMIGNADVLSFSIDGFYFGDAAVCRVAREKFPGEGGTLGQSGNPIRMKVITDKIGKDDSLKASDDSGLMAQLAYSELLRSGKPTVSGKFTTPMIADFLPGQYVYIGQDWRVTRLVHTIKPKPFGFRTEFEVTDDVTNSHVRLRYEDQNKLASSVRPEWQDKQATSIKVGDLDIRIARLKHINCFIVPE